MSNHNPNRCPNCGDTHGPRQDGLCPECGGDYTWQKQDGGPIIEVKCDIAMTTTIEVKNDQ